MSYRNHEQDCDCNNPIGTHRRNGVTEDSFDPYEHLRVTAELYGGCYSIYENGDGNDLSTKIIKKLNIKYESDACTPIIYEPQKYTISKEELQEFNDNNIELLSDSYDFYIQTILEDDRHTKRIGGMYTNMYSHNYIVIFGKSFDLIKLAGKAIMGKPEVKKATGKIFEWDVRNNRYITSSSSCSKVNREDLVGLDDIFRGIETDIHTMCEKKELLAKLNMTSGFNNLLYGPPGTGKTSSIKTLAHILNVPIFVVKLISIPATQLSNALCPNLAFYGISGDISIVLVEDFDRYLKGDDVDKIKSELLNALDGVYAAPNTMRFFSANLVETVFDDTAIASRMRRIIHYPLPTIEHIEKHLVNIFPNFQVHIAKLCNILQGKELSIRTINNYISRFVLAENPVAEAIENIDSWFEEISTTNKN